MPFIQETCRVCLDNNNLNKIFKEDSQIADKIMYCGSVQICIGDKLPQLICNQCLFYLDIAYIFRTVCEATDAKLRQCVEPTEDIETIGDFHVANEVVIDSIGSVEFNYKQNCSSASDSSMDDGTGSNKFVKSVENSKVGRHIAKKNAGKCPQRCPPVGTSESEPDNGSVHTVMSQDENTVKTSDEEYGTRTGLKLRRSSKIDVNKKKKSLEKKIFPCNACSKSFLYKSHLMRHLTMHTQIKKFTCYYCNKKFINRYNLSVHLRKHTGDFPLSCKFCGRGFSAPSLLERHVNSHVGNLKYQCRYCPKKVLHSSSLKLHEKMHISKPTYTCDICLKSFTYTNSLNEHKKTHLGLKRYSCSVCFKSFTRKTSLTRHMSGHHSLLQCRQCNFSCNNNSNYVTHMKSHRKFLCNICAEFFASKPLLLTHMNLVHKKVLQCEECLKEFISKSQLIKHLQRHVNMN